MRQVIMLCLAVAAGWSLSGCDTGSRTSSATNWPEASFDGLGSNVRPAEEVAEGLRQRVYVPVYLRLLLSREGIWEMSTS